MKQSTVLSFGTSNRADTTLIARPAVPPAA